MNLNHKFSTILLGKGLSEDDVLLEWNFILESYASGERKFKTISNLIKTCEFLTKHFSDYEFYEDMFLALVYKDVVFNKKNSEETSRSEALSILMFRLDDYISTPSFQLIRGMYNGVTEPSIIAKVFRTVELSYLMGSELEVSNMLNAQVEERNFTTMESGLSTIIYEINKKLLLGTLPIDGQQITLNVMTTK